MSTVLSHITLYTQSTLSISNRIRSSWTASASDVPILASVSWVSPSKLESVLKLSHLGRVLSFLSEGHYLTSSSCCWSWSFSSASWMRMTSSSSSLPPSPLTPSVSYRWTNELARLNTVAALAYVLRRYIKEGRLPAPGSKSLKNVSDISLALITLSLRSPRPSILPSSRPSPSTSVKSLGRSGFFAFYSNTSIRL